MKRKILLLGIMALSLCGCASKSYGLINDFDEVNANAEDYHVVFAMGDDGCYSDGTFEANQMYAEWVADYESRH